MMNVKDFAMKYTPKRTDPVALTLYQPWAAAVVRGIKKWETRSWNTEYRGIVYIHAGKAFTDAARDKLATNPVTFKEPVFGCIIGSVEIVRVRRTQDIYTELDSEQVKWGDFTVGRWAWELVNPIELPHPVECRGYQRFWRVKADVLAVLNDNIATPDAIADR